MSKINYFLLISLLALTLACKKDQATEATDTSAMTAEPATTPTDGGDPELTPEEQAVQTYARARKLSESTQSGYIKNPTTVHERIASRIARRVGRVTEITAAQETQLLELVKSYPEASIKGKEGKDKRQEISERAYQEVLTAEQQAKVDQALMLAQ